MLKLIVDNKELDLGSLKGITLNYNPGLFENGDFKGSYVVPLTLEPSDINDEIFGFKYKIGNVDTEIIELPIEIWHSGIQISEGFVSAKKFTSKKINCNIYIDNGTLFKDFNEKTVNENDFDGEKNFPLKTEYDPLTDDFLLFRVRNEDYFSNVPSFDPVTNIYYGQNQNYYALDYVGTGFAPAPYANSAVTPFPVLWNSLRKLFLNKGFLYNDNFFNQSPYNLLCIFNTVNAVTQTFEQNSDNEFISKNELTTYDLANHMPRILTNEFIKALQNFFNIKFYVRETNVKVLDRLELIQSNEYDNLESFIVGDYDKEITGLNYNGIAYTLKRDENDRNTSGLNDVSGFNDIIESITGSFPVSAPNIVTLLASSPFIEGRYWKYQQKQSLVSGDYYWVWDVTASGGAGEFEGTKNYNLMEGVFLREKDYTLESNLNNIPMVDFLEENVTPNVDYPTVKMIGNSYQHSEFTDFGLRLMIYNGLQELENAGSTTIQPQGVNKIDNFSISGVWSYYNRWKEYLEWYFEAAKEKYSQKIQLTASQIKNFTYERKKLINGHFFFITNMQVQLTRKEVLPAKCTMIKANF